MTVTSSFPPFSSLLPSLPTKSILKLVRHKRRVFDPWIGKILWRRKRQPTLVFLPGESHEQRVSEDSWRVTVHRVSKSRPQLKRLSTHACRIPTMQQKRVRENTCRDRKLRGRRFRYTTQICGVLLCNFWRWLTDLALCFLTGKLKEKT